MVLPSSFSHPSSSQPERRKDKQSEGTEQNVQSYSHERGVDDDDSDDDYYSDSDGDDYDDEAFEFEGKSVSHGGPNASLNWQQAHSAGISRNHVLKTLTGMSSSVRAPGRNTVKWRRTPQKFLPRSPIRVPSASSLH